MNTCINCRFAKWDRTESGRLSPSGSGRCIWQMPQIKVPKAMYHHAPLKPSGGYIDRHDPARYADCPAWEAIQKLEVPQ